MHCPTCNVHETEYFEEPNREGPFDFEAAFCVGCEKQWRECDCPEVGSIATGPSA